MKTIILCLIAAAATAISMSLLYENQGMRSQYDAGYQKGWKEALHKRPVNQELELVCAGLWIGEQNKKYWEKENAQK